MVQHLLVELTPNGTTVLTGYSAGTIHAVRLIEYKGEGLLSTTNTIFFTIRNQNVSQIYGNVHTSYYPLFFDRVPDQFIMLNNPINITNGQRWNDAHQLQFDLVDRLGNTFTQFTRLYLMFDILDSPQNELFSNVELDLTLEQQ